ncbi:hypothetical protein [Psychromonas aquimarina]|uniref:hypothetical protein n=1 Tax=Psychromonas aquimarina TaxID=444919 RepID=UPI00068469B4|nr:hypothetical protein [Psychromonas aquimarina]
MSIKAIIEKASEGTLDEKEVIAFSGACRISLDEFAHEFSKYVAQNYWDGLYDYSFCDGAMNWLYGFLTDPAYLESNDNTISEFPLEVYLAFDAGEYRHSGDEESVDPVRKYTDPAIDKVLSAKNSYKAIKSDIKQLAIVRASQL